MEIKKECKRYMLFHELSIGEVFEIYGDVYLKVNVTGIENNALDLHKNTLTSFGANEVIVKLQAELSVW